MLDFYFDPKWLFKCGVKVLIVVDGGVGFDKTASFGLGHVLDALASDPWSHVDFQVTKAHRQNGVGADVIDNFRFDVHDLGQYSQIWLFGIASQQDSLSQPELRALSEFMDGGGGVLAMGDHENLGQAMCGEIPRVRSMRRWYYDEKPGGDPVDAGPNGEPVAPAQTGAYRHDTVMSGGSQSDSIPQPIRPRYYTRTVGSGIVYQVQKYPHPVLCGPDGVIDCLPDHMHEGLCEVPSDLTKSYTFAGYTTQEYPSNTGAHPERPEVIAWATDRNSGGSEFGVVGAYDGHRESIGRVVVDATWHHWFNINLVGFVNASDPANAAYDPAVAPQWEKIKAYFRNVGAWLARPSLQKCLRNGGWLLAIKSYDFQVVSQAFGYSKFSLPYVYKLGTTAKDALGRLASKCQTTNWVIDLIPEYFEWEFDPWILDPPRPLPDPPRWLDPVELEATLLGGAVHELDVAFGTERNLEKLVECDGEKVFEVARRGAHNALRELMRHQAECGQGAQELLARIE